MTVTQVVDILKQVSEREDRRKDADNVQFYYLVQNC